MRLGEFEEGARVLRAKIDMASRQSELRDPVIYRILQATHHRSGDKWCIYPMYDFTHGLSIRSKGSRTRSARWSSRTTGPLYDWVLDELGIYHPQQIEFARLNLNYTVMSKRKLLQLVHEGLVSGWDDPRMPTISGLRRRGFTPEAIRDFCRRDRRRQEQQHRRYCPARVPHPPGPEPARSSPDGRAHPLKLVIDNYPDGLVEEMEAVNNPEDPSAWARRRVPFSKVLYIEQEDFRNDPPKQYFRLAPGREVRLRYAYFVTCTGM